MRVFLSLNNRLGVAWIMAVISVPATLSCSLKYRNALARPSCDAEIGDLSPEEDINSDLACADLNTSNPTGDECLYWTCNETSHRCEIMPKDADGDEHIDQACAPEGAENLDCDDDNAHRYVGADNLEVCDYVDNDCDGDVDEGLAYGVTEEHLWPLGDIPQPDAVSFAAQSTPQGLVLAATFDYGPDPSNDPVPEAGLSVWSEVDVLPDPFRAFDKRIIIQDGPAEGVSPECIDDPPGLPACDGTPSWLITKKYHNSTPIIADDDIGIVAAAADGGAARYFAGLVQSETSETLVRIHEDFHANPVAGVDTGYAAAAWTERGLMVTGIKSCTDCVPDELTNRDVFVHLLENDTATQAWVPASTSSSTDHRAIGNASAANSTPAIVGLPSGNWLIAHLQETPSVIRLTLAKAINETTGDIETFPLVDIPPASNLALAVGSTQGDTSTIALGYVTNSRAQVTFLSLVQEPTPQATELLTVQAPIEGDSSPAHSRPLVAFHPHLSEWLFAWQDSDSRIGFVRLAHGGEIITDTFTYSLAQEGRVLDQGFGLTPVGESDGYALVTYAEDNTASVFVTAPVGCGIP